METANPNRRSEMGDGYVEELSKKVRSRVPCTMFEITLLTKIEENPDSTIRECWDFANQHFQKLYEKRGEKYNEVPYSLKFRN